MQFLKFYKHNDLLKNHRNFFFLFTENYPIYSKLSPSLCFFLKGFLKLLGNFIELAVNLEKF